MSTHKPLPSALDGTGLRVGVVASRFNPEVVERLLDGALAALESHGVARSDIEVVRVPGAWEIPLALEALAARGGLDALVALGAVIRGETAHFEYVAGECSRGVAEVGRGRRVPIGFGVLTCETAEQAMARAGGVAGNKGEEAALAALEMAGLLGRIRTGA
ncbi:MAG: 6,7-dimethyl-8-ribityllumazine synthase [Thermoanaerobaculia bacterium]|nr:MAG: 6,7-dimethyl-8-ribityllumazine synthase [Thermoanaerobaculia bacterium]